MAGWDRYDVGWDPDHPGFSEMHSADDGRWVRFEQAEARLREVEAERDAAIEEADRLKAAHRQAEQRLRERLLSDEALTAAMGAWPAAHVPHTLRPEDYGGLGDPRLMRACRKAEAQNREVAAGVIEAALDTALSSTEQKGAGR